MDGFVSHQIKKKIVCKARTTSGLYSLKRKIAQTLDNQEFSDEHQLDTAERKKSMCNLPTEDKNNDNLLLK